MLFSLSCLSDETLNRGPMTTFQDKLLKKTDCDEAGDYVVPNVLSPRDLVFRPYIGHKLYHHPVQIPYSPSLIHLISTPQILSFTSLERVDVCMHACMHTRAVPINCISINRLISGDLVR